MLEQITARLLPQSADGITRRNSLRAIGSAALGASAVVTPARVGARKNRRRRKQKGQSCADRERQRCAIDAAACRDTALRTCETAIECGYALTCCEECTATGFLLCIFGIN